MLPVLLSLLGPWAVQEAAPSLAELLEKYCLSCHSGEEPKGELDLSLLAPNKVDPAEEAWALILAALEEGAMPPRRKEQPSAEERATMIRALREALPEQQGIEHGRGPRRLTRRELLTTVQDLTGVVLDPLTLPEEADLGRFDVLGSGFASDARWLELWIEQSLQIAREAIAETDPEPGPPQRVAAGEFEGSFPAGRLYTNGESRAAITLPREGLYRFRARAFAEQAGAEQARVALRLDQRSLHEQDLEGQGRSTVNTIEIEARADEGPHSFSLAFLNDYYQPDAPDPGERDRNVILLELSVEGPLDVRPPTQFQQSLIPDLREDMTPDEIMAGVVRGLIHRAWRRAPTEDEQRDLVGLSAGEDSLVARLRLTLAAVLASPHFLYLAQDPAPDPAQRARGLAERLALSLWASLPDEELLEAAASAELLDPDRREAELLRLLADSRSRRFVQGFATQWLQLRRLASHRPDPVLYPEYDEDLRRAMEAEPLDLFACVLREDLPVSALLAADWTFAEPRLAQHYGFEGEGASGRYELADSSRRGLLGQAAILTAASAPDRSSPVLRGKWVLECLLGAPPPQPPPGTLTLDETAPAVEGLSLRQRLDLHRASPDCAACHVDLDPLGFALERFDALGREREGQIDERGELPDGFILEGPLDLCAHLLRDGRFPGHLAEELATYCLARELSSSEAEDLARAVRFLGADPTLRRILVTIVRSDWFLPRLSQ